MVTIISYHLSSSSFLPLETLPTSFFRHHHYVTELLLILLLHVYYYRHNCVILIWFPLSEQTYQDQENVNGMVWQRCLMVEFSCMVEVTQTLAFSMTASIYTSFANNSRKINRSNSTKAAIYCCFRLSTFVLCYFYYSFKMVVYVIFFSFIIVYYKSWVILRFPAALLFPYCAAALVHNSLAFFKSLSTPKPLQYMFPKLYCASESPKCAAGS